MTRANAADLVLPLSMYSSTAIYAAVTGMPQAQPGRRRNAEDLQSPLGSARREMVPAIPAPGSAGGWVRFCPASVRAADSLQAAR